MFPPRGLLTGVLVVMLGSLQPGMGAQVDVSMLRLMSKYRLDGSSVRQVDISADRHDFIAGTASGTVIHGATSEPTNIHQRSLPDSIVRARFFGPGADAIVVTESGEAYIWTLPDSARAPIDFAAVSRHAEISEDGRYVAFGGQVYDRLRGAEYADVAHEAAQSSLDVAGDLVLTSGYHDSRLLVRNLATKSRKARDAGGGVNAAALSPNGEYVLAATDKREAALWRLSPRSEGVEPIGRWPTSSQDVRIVFSRSGTRAAIIDGERVRVIDLGTAETLREELLAAAAWSADFSRDGKALATGDADGNIRVWDIEADRIVGRAHFEDGIYSVSFEDPYLLVGTHDGVIALLLLESEPRYDAARAPSR